MKENDVVLRTITKIVVFILLTFGFYLFLAGHNNPGGGCIGGLVFRSAFLFMFLSFDVKQVLVALPLDFSILMIIGSLVSFATAVVPMFFGKSILCKTDSYVQLRILREIHLTTVTIFEAGIVLAVVDVVVTVMLSISCGRS